MSVSVFTPRFIAVRSITALMLREMSTSYGRSPGGYLWAILGPVAAISLLSVAFAFALRAPAMGSSFMLFYSTGLLPLTMYRELSQNLSTALKFSRGLLTYPNVSYMDSILSRLILNGLTQMVVFSVVLTGVIWFDAPDTSVDLPTALSAFAMIFAFSFGVGTFNSIAFSLVPVWSQFWAILNRPLLLISGIFFLMDELPAEARELLLWNPVAHIVMQMRAAFYSNYDGVYVSLTYVYLVSGVFSLVGLILLRRYSRVALDEGA